MFLVGFGRRRASKQKAKPPSSRKLLRYPHGRTPRVLSTSTTAVCVIKPYCCDQDGLCTTAVQHERWTRCSCCPRLQRTTDKARNLKTTPKHYCTSLHGQTLEPFLRVSPVQANPVRKTLLGVAAVRAHAAALKALFGSAHKY